MQQPTCTNVRIRSTNDAHKIFAAIQKGLLFMVTRRLDADERLALRSGCIYAWEERGPHSELTGLGIERFTEGRRWSPSRVRDEFLFYYEKYTPPPETLNSNSTERQLQPPRDWDPLVKQTYSVWVQTEKGRRKWHLTAYFTQSTIDQLQSIDDHPELRDIVVEDGMFKSTRVGKSRSAKNDDRSDGVKSSSASRAYAPFPTPYQYQQHNDSNNTTPVPLHEPYQIRHQESPEYDQTPSPITTPSHLYSGTSASAAPGPYTSPGGYPISSNTMNPGNLPRYRVPALHNTDSGPDYYSPSSSSHSWEGSGSAYYTSPRNDHQHHQHHQHHEHQHQHDSNGARVPFLPASQNNYNRLGTTLQSTATPHAPYQAAFPSGTMHGSANTVFSPSYSLHAALSLPGSEPAGLPLDLPAPPLSPLHLPGRMQGAAQDTTNTTTPPYAHLQGMHLSQSSGSQGGGDGSMDAGAGAGGDQISPYGSLLPPLRRPAVARYVRNLQDEKDLRRLRERSNS